MNDYTVGWMTRQRHADYLHEVEHDELVDQLRAEAEEPSPAPGGRPVVAPPVEAPVRHRWRRLLAHVVPRRPIAHGHRP